ncbi:AT-hook motif nuclear-localized protein 29-like [Cicer arietinum]|uniref:AT-hook motif nuclear-localized protein 29-like n=1 Tax=Cicer arietinum TaxID=3827 RepID=A0A1S2XLV0_CICAR|nr:AT-hook motif nuclear-localized protein 29-like [Cicer arietinum]
MSDIEENMVFDDNNGESSNALQSHMFEITAGSDVVESLFNYAQRRGRGICILSGNGVVTHVSLRQSTGRILPLRGKFQILSIIGTVLPPPMSMSQGGEGLSVYLSHTVGQVVGGNVVAPLMASSSVILMVACFADAKIVRLPLVVCDQDEEEPSCSTADSPPNPPRLA